MGEGRGGGGPKGWGGEYCAGLKPPFFSCIQFYETASEQTQMCDCNYNYSYNFNFCNAKTLIVLKRFTKYEKV